MEESPSERGRIITDSEAGGLRSKLEESMLKSGLPVIAFGGKSIDRIQHEPELDGEKLTIWFNTGEALIITGQFRVDAKEVGDAAGGQG